MNDDIVQFIFKVTKESLDRGELSIWTVFDHPLDYPEAFVARRGVADKDGYHPTQDAIAGELADIRLAMEICGFVRMPRAEVDPMNIVETWM
jgi:hypothetical protein